jgi:SIR2-like domain
VPTAFAMTDRIAGRLAVRQDGPELLPAFRFVCDRLRARGNTRVGTLRKGLDVERVFAAVELLATRRGLDIVPFVDRWAPGLGSSELTPAAFQKLAAAIGHELRGLVITHPDDCQYLSALVAAGRSHHGVTIATLNYDLTVEQCAESHGVRWDTGMESWVVYGVWMWRDEGVRLLKLHGSISEAWTENDYWDGFLPHQGIHSVDDPRVETQPPVLAFGGAGTKLKSEGPFVSLLLEFESQLRDAESLLVIGYSFRDDHINNAIVRWSHFSTGRKLFIVDPDWPDDARGLPEGDFRRMLARHLLPPAENPDAFQSRLEVIREPCSKALKRYAGEFDPN